MKNVIVLFVVLALVSTAGAAVVLEHDFAATADGVATSDGQAISTGSYTDTNFRDSSGNGIDGQDMFGTATYTVGSTPAGSWDGRGVSFDGSSGNGVRYNDAPLGNAFAGSFSAFARVYGNGDGHIMGNGANNNGWDLVVYNGNLVLNIWASGTGFDNINTGIAIPTGQWSDIGMSFDGTTGDAGTDVFSIYFNGAKQVEMPGVATFTASPYGFPFAIGAGHFGGNARASVYDHVIVWDEVISDADFAAIPEPATMLLLGLGGLAAIRRKRS